MATPKIDLESPHNPDFVSACANEHYYRRLIEKALLLSPEELEYKCYHEISVRHNGVVELLDSCVAIPTNVIALLFQLVMTQVTLEYSCSNDGDGRDITLVVKSARTYYLELASWGLKSLAFDVGVGSGILRGAWIPWYLSKIQYEECLRWFQTWPVIMPKEWFEEAKRELLERVPKVLVPLVLLYIPQ